MNLLRHEQDKNIEDNIIKDVWDIFKLKKENEEIKEKIIRYIRNFLELEMKKKIIINQWSS